MTAIEDFEKKNMIKKIRKLMERYEISLSDLIEAESLVIGKRLKLIIDEPVVEGEDHE